MPPEDKPTASPENRRRDRYWFPALLGTMVVLVVVCRALDLGLASRLMWPTLLILMCTPVTGVIVWVVFCPDGKPDITSVSLAGLMAFVQFAIMLLPLYFYLRKRTKKLLRLQLAIAAAYLAVIAWGWLSPLFGL